VSWSIAIRRNGRFARLNQFHGWLLQRSFRAVGLSALLGLAICIPITITVGWTPAPIMHDEFSYLLGADTFVRGRLTNPTHPLWQHFETFHVIHQPSYASKYPPGQALLLALGQRLTGAPIIGVWIGYALMCGAITWMMQAWTKPRWALWGGVFIALLFGGLNETGGYWTTTYWGGALAATGGALLFGGVKRIVRNGSASSAGPPIAVAIGLAVLANTRPFEGLLSAIPLLLVLSTVAYSSFRRRQRVAWIGVISRVLVPVVIMMGYYNYRVTGQASQFPYLQYEQQYSSAPVLLGQAPPPPPAYRHRAIACFYTAGGGYVAPLPTVNAYFVDLRRRFGIVRDGYAPPFVWPLVLMIPWAILRAPPWLALASLTGVAIGFFATPWQMLPHYAAPAIAGYVILITMSARRLHALRMRKWRFGRTVLRLVQISLILNVAWCPIAFYWTRDWRFQRWEWQRSRMIEELSASPEKHLVMVTYGRDHNPHNEWVNNAADIDGSSVVWARSMGREKDRQLLKYFSYRRAWRLHVGQDTGPFRLQSIDSTMFSRERSDSVLVGERDELSCPL
jgi:hypothetical protein